MRSFDQFANTRWSMVMQAGGGDAAGAGDALVELAWRYWYPAYAYVRECGHAPANAERLVRSFLGGIAAEFRDGASRPPDGQFRRFFLDQLKRFLDAPGRAPDELRVEDLPPAPADLEQRHRRDNAGAASAEQAYEHSFALEIVTRALKRLRDEAGDTDRLALFDALLPFLAREPDPAELSLLAASLQRPRLTIVVALKRLRQRFREIAGHELADTVTTADGLAAEQLALQAILRDLPVR